jgi:epoxyqueuosine reductase
MTLAHSPAACPERSRRKLLAMSQAEFSAAFKGSPVKRVKRRGLARNAAFALGNVGTADDIAALEAAFDHDEPLVREHAAWTLARVRDRSRPPGH